MKLIDYDQDKKIETWKCLKMGANDAYILNNFMANGHRIYDLKENRVINTRLDLKKWLRDSDKLT
ncbi:hypothetical protein PIL02S_03440 [Paenibacillus illinoisensis]|uniref:Uncharacterized protein n=2 Tax=Paenibacillus illinoisensis TaxID=59845 RepID=A0A2W0CC68_9BACL|nr:hypothetical protein PIL02S_03440 [Paenibacillus illinoisensis]